MGCRVFFMITWSVSVVASERWLLSEVEISRTVVTEHACPERLGEGSRTIIFVAKKVSVSQTSKTRLFLVYLQSALAKRSKLS